MRDSSIDILLGFDGVAFHNLTCSYALSLRIASTDTNWSRINPDIRS